MKSLAHRVERLESRRVLDRLTVIFSCLTDSEVIGYRVKAGAEPIDILKRAGESDEALLRRAEAMHPHGLLVLTELRA